MKDRFIRLYFNIARELADMSYDPNTKVGCVLVKGDKIIGEGYNGRATGEDNQCKDENGNTLPEVIHGEMNVIARAARKGISTDDGILFSTHSPCFTCAKLIYLSGIKEVYYLNIYKDHAAIEYLKKHGVKLYHIIMEDLNDA